MQNSATQSFTKTVITCDKPTYDTYTYVDRGGPGFCMTADNKSYKSAFLYYTAAAADCRRACGKLQVAGITCFGYMFNGPQDSQSKCWLFLAPDGPTQGDSSEGGGRAQLNAAHGGSWGWGQGTSFYPTPAGGTPGGQGCCGTGIPVSTWQHPQSWGAGYGNCWAISPRPASPAGPAARSSRKPLAVYALGAFRFDITVSRVTLASRVT